MSYCRSPIYVIQRCGGIIQCFDTHHHKDIVSIVPKGDPDECAYDHMRWHVRAYNEEKDFDNANYLEMQILDAMTTPFYKKWYHHLDPWRWLYWRRRHKIDEWLDESGPAGNYEGGS